TLALGGKNVDYDIRPSPRAQHMRLTMYPGGKVVLTMLRRFTHDDAKRFMRSHSRWLLRALQKLERVAPKKHLPSGLREYRARKEQARQLVRERLGHFNSFYGYAIGRISIRNQKSRWGSCSRRGDMNFNFKLVHLPPQLADYIIVHELCHIEEHNHSGRFWALVAKTVPHHASLRRALRAYSLR